MRPRGTRFVTTFFKPISCVFKCEEEGMAFKTKIITFTAAFLIGAGAATPQLALSAKAATFPSKSSDARVSGVGIPFARVDQAEGDQATLMGYSSLGIRGLRQRRASEATLYLPRTSQPAAQITEFVYISERSGILCSAYVTAFVYRKMKKLSSVSDRRSRRFMECASLATIAFIVALSLICIEPALAGTYGSAAPEISADPYGSPMISDQGYPWDVTPPALGNPALAPAPQPPVAYEPEPMRGGFLPESPGGLRGSLADPTIPATSPLLVSPLNSAARPGGGFYPGVR